MLRAAFLALLAVAGPLQAQLIYACSVMEQSFQGSCCCEDLNQAHDPLAAQDCLGGSAGSPELVERPCCDTDLEISVSQDAEDGVLGPSQHTRDANPDPPQPIAVLPSDSPVVLAPRTATSHAAGVLVPWQAGTATYLLTQRLRI